MINFVTPINLAILMIAIILLTGISLMIENRIVFFCDTMFVVLVSIFVVYNYNFLFNVYQNCEASNEEFYYIGAEIDSQNDEVTAFIDENGNLWDIDTNPNWNKDCIYLLTMDSKNTNDIADDEIVVVWAECTSDYYDALINPGISFG